jgi:type II secretory pathway component PulL
MCRNKAKIHDRIFVTWNRLRVFICIVLVFVVQMQIKTPTFASVCYVATYYHGTSFVTIYNID